MGDTTRGTAITTSSGDLTRLLRAWSGGQREVETELLPLVYRELQAIAGSHLRRERAGHTLQRTDLVHESYLRLVELQRLRWKDRRHFYAMASRTMRRILIDHARRREAGKRGNGASPAPIDAMVAGLAVEGEDLLAVHDALTGLESLDPIKASIVEMRFFGGLSMNEIAATQNCSKRTVARHWRAAKAWLSRELSREARDET